MQMTECTCWKVSHANDRMYILEGVSCKWQNVNAERCLMQMTGCTCWKVSHANDRMYMLEGVSCK